MKTIKAIIGANYGDEGKGLLTRYFAIKEKNPVIILYHGSVHFVRLSMNIENF